VQGYLLDNQTVNFWFNQKLPEHANVAAHVNALAPGTPLNTSVIVLGEIAFGHRRAVPPDLAKQQALNAFLRDQFPEPLHISKHTPMYYAEIRALLFKTFPPQGKRQAHPERCFDKVTATELGIEENDLWITSQAYEHNLVLVTHDKLVRIREVAGHLIVVEDWTDPL